MRYIYSQADLKRSPFPLLLRPCSRNKRHVLSQQTVSSMEEYLPFQAMVMQASCPKQFTGHSHVCALSLASKSIAWASKAMFRSTSKRKKLIME